MTDVIPGTRRIGHRPLTPQAAAALVALAALAFQLLWYSGRLYSWDDMIQVGTARALVTAGDLAIPDSPEARIFAGKGRDGRLYSKFGLAMPALLVPFFAAGSLAGPRAAVMAACLANPVVIAATAGLFFLTALQLGASRRSSAFGALVLAAASPLAVYGRAVFNDPLVALALLAAFRSWLRQEDARCGAALALAFATRAEYAIVIPAFFLVSTPARWKRLATPLVAVGGLVLAYNAFQYGHPLNQGQIGQEPGDTFSTPLHVGLFGLLLSWGKGVIWYCPPLLPALAGWRHVLPSSNALIGRGRALVLLALVVAPALVLHALWHSWMGGWSYGPRRLVALLPLLLLGLPFALDRLRRGVSGATRAGVALTLVAGAFAQLGGLVVDFMAYIAWANERGISTLWSIEGTAALGHWRYLAATGRFDNWSVYVFGPTPVAATLFLLAALGFLLTVRIALRATR